MDRVRIAGVGIHPFGRFEKGYRELGASAVHSALQDAQVRPSEVDLTFCAHVNLGMAAGQNILDLVGANGNPIINVEAACGSSGSALQLAGQAIEMGTAKIVLCFGVEKAPRGFIAKSGYENWQLETGLGVNPVYFAIQAHELITETEATKSDLADVSVKNHAHAVHNPNAMYRDAVTREQVLGSKPVCPPLHLLMLCAPNEGAAAAVLMSDEEAQRRGLTGPRLRAVSLVSKTATDWFVPSVSRISEGRTSLSSRAARRAFEEAGVGPEDLDFVECQDTDSASELIAYRDLGLCPEGEEAKLLRSGATQLGGRVPVNTSGGLLSKGEPLGASGLGQLHEIVTQLRGHADGRQVDDAKVGLGHVIGAGHTASVMIVSR